MTDEALVRDDRTPRWEPPELPEAAELKNLAAGWPEKLYDLAWQFSRWGNGQGADEDFAARAMWRIAETLAVTQSWACAKLAADIVGRLVTPRPAYREERHRLPRSVAAKLARRQHLLDLEPLFRELPEELNAETEVRACVLGELGLMGHGRARPLLDAYSERLRELAHPLARLPRTRLAFEHRLDTRFRGGPSPTDLERLRASYPDVPPTPGAAAAARTASEVPDLTRAEAAAEPFHVAEWACEPEARFFTLPDPLDPAEFNIAFLKALPLECLQGERNASGEAAAVHTTGDDVLADLFSAPFSGGVYGDPQGGAYARFYAWRSLYALMDLPAETPYPFAVRTAADHRWLRFEAYTDWFHSDMADTAFAVLDPTRTRVAVLAATDTD